MGGYVDPADFDLNFWRVLAPDEPEPSTEEMEQELARRTRDTNHRARHP